MKPIPAFARANILFFFEFGLSTRIISSHTMARNIKEIHPGKENIKLGCSSKLSSINRRKLVSSTTSDKVKNTIQATHLTVKSAFSSSVSAQTIRNILKSASFKAVLKKKKLLLSVKHR